jgi:hypothetical protein
VNHAASLHVHTSVAGIVVYLVVVVQIVLNYLYKLIYCFFVLFCRFWMNWKDVSLWQQSDR